MKNEPIITSTLDKGKKGRTDWARLDAMTDEEIERKALEENRASGIADAWYKDAELVTPSARKQRITIMLDGDLIDHFKKEGRGYQTRINAVLRAYVIHQKRSTQYPETPL